VPVLIQICIAVATIAVVGIAVALIRVLGQLQKTAAQVERTMVSLDQSIPTIVHAVDETRGVLESLNQVVARVDHIAGDFETVGAKAAKVSSLVVDQVLAPASQVAALVAGVRGGASFLMDGLRKRRESRLTNTGGNHHE
jgi:uncharacterized protein YoxC